MDAVQDVHFKDGMCFGCGPANGKGLRIKSRWEEFAGERVFVARWRPEPHHMAFPGFLNGGIIGALMDCHSNWCAATTLMDRDALEGPPSTVTAEFHVKLAEVTPMDQELTITARATDVGKRAVTVEASITTASGDVTATCRGVFVAVPEGHPADHRWA